MILPLAMRGPHYRDGVVTYNQYRGVPYNIKVEGPGGGQNAHFQRRHAPKQHKQKKPWMKLCYLCPPGDVQTLRRYIVLS